MCINEHNGMHFYRHTTLIAIDDLTIGAAVTRFGEFMPVE